MAGRRAHAALDQALRDLDSEDKTSGDVEKSRQDVLDEDVADRRLRAVPALDQHRATGTVDEAQCRFLYKVMKDNFLHHEAKSIVHDHRIDQDVREIWKKVCKYYDDSITTSMSADILLAYVSGVKLDKANWNKGQGEVY